MVKFAPNHSPRHFVAAATVLFFCLLGQATASEVNGADSFRRLLTANTKLKCLDECSSQQCDPGSFCNTCRPDTEGVKRCFAATYPGVGSVPKNYRRPFPNPTGVVTSKSFIGIPENTVFDGGMKRYQLNRPCGGDAETGDEEAAFVLQDGATLQNAIIGKDQSQGVRCHGNCRLINVWFEDVCEDAITHNGRRRGDTGTFTMVIDGGGVRKASDKIVQANAKGTVKISNFYAEDFGKVYRSCGNCEKYQYQRHVQLENIVAVRGYMLAGINPQPYGDTATFKNITATGVQVTCGKYLGTNVGRQVNDHPKLVSTGYDKTSCRLLS